MTLVQDFLPAEADTSNDMTTNQAIVDACREAGFKAYIEWWVVCLEWRNKQSMRLKLVDFRLIGLRPLSINDQLWIKFLN